MSVILGCPNRTMKVFVKGADTSMFNVIDKSSNFHTTETKAHLHAFSSMGLRTLVVGKRELSSSKFEQCQSSYDTASTAVMGMAALLRKVATNVENNLIILCSSGIEDKLQQGVPEAIESLRRADIKVWVLTGDKQLETAISIGYSCKLLTRRMTEIVINNRSEESCKKSLDDALTLFKNLLSVSGDTHNTGRSSEDGLGTAGLIIDGTSLVYILDTKLEDQVTSRCTVVLCCRVAPLHKAGIVALIKKRTSDMTPAFGDGANDVSMIQMADVGIGISGKL